MVAATLRHLKSLRLMVCSIPRFLCFKTFEMSLCNSYVGKKNFISVVILDGFTPS